MNNLTYQEYWSALRQIRQDTRSRCMIDIDSYNNNTLVKEYTNCMAYALGTKVTVSELFRPGMISKKKLQTDSFESEYELAQMFISDCDYLNLHITPFGSKGEDLLRFESEFKFRTSEYMIGLFALKYADGKIRGFHFIRYDPSIGWSEKMSFGGYARKMDSIIYLDKWEYSFAKGFIVHKSHNNTEIPWDEN